jgi:hypothetical protein
MTLIILTRPASSPATRDELAEAQHVMFLLIMQESMPKHDKAFSAQGRAERFQAKLLINLQWC